MSFPENIDLMLKFYLIRNIKRVCTGASTHEREVKIPRMKVVKSLNVIWHVNE